MYCFLNLDDILCYICYRYLKEKKIFLCLLMNGLKFFVKFLEFDLI